jgi:Family of unknown function (DUF5329)
MLVIAFQASVYAASTYAAPVKPTVRAEIDALLAKLDASSCEFNRNGTWYGAAEAKKHLLQKLDYLERRSLVQTTEQFIERAASASSMSGLPYLVRCNKAEPINSKVWLQSVLATMRSQ